MWLRPKGARRYFAEGIIKTEDHIKMPLSVAIIARNEEERLPDCLRSVRFADDVVVVDSGSVDNTVKIAKSFGARVFVREWMGFSGQKQFAVDQCRHDWVLILDSDERIPEGTAKVVQREIAGTDRMVSAYSFKRKNYLHGRWIKRCGWWPDRVVRLVNKNEGRFSGRAVHERWLPDGKVKGLDACIEHVSFRNCSELVAKMESYSNLSAEELFQKGTRVNAMTPVLHGLWMFVMTYFFQLGILERFEGFLISIMNAGGSFLKYVNLRETFLQQVGADMKDKANGKAKAWLILAHCFNMDGRAASQTITDRIPFLIKNGVMPVVLSAPHGIKDHHFPHYRVLSCAPSGILFEMRHIIKRKIPRPAIQKMLKGVLTLVCLPFLILEKSLIHLDSHWSWFMGGTITGYFLIKKYRPELIYSTAGPSSTHLTGYILKCLCRLPWIAELHDPLVYDGKGPKWQKYWFDKWLEKAIFRKASAVIFFSEMALKRALERNPIQGKGHLLRPGAEPPDFSKSQYQRRKRIHFGHFGSLAGTRNLGVIIRGLHELLAENLSWREMICLDIYGCDLDSVSQRFLSNYPLDGAIHKHGRLEYDPVSRKSGRQRVLEAMRKSDVLLLVHGEGMVCQEYIPSKLYEYFLTRRPVMGLVSKNSELERFLEDGGHVAVDENDKTQVKQAISEFVLRWESEGLPDYDRESPFTVKTAVAQLLEIARGIS